MNAITSKGKEYVHIIEVHSLKELEAHDESIKDHKPNIKIACLKDSDIDWVQIMSNGVVPIVKGSPSILRSTVNEYVFTDEFWMCDCEFDWLHAKHFKCEECGCDVITKKHTLNKVSDFGLWTPIQFEDALLTMADLAIENKDAFAGIAHIYQHCNLFNFDWPSALSVNNY